MKPASPLAAVSELIARNNRLADDGLPKSFAVTDELRELNLGGNVFTTFPEQVLDFVNLRYLYLGGNAITNVPAHAMPAGPVTVDLGEGTTRRRVRNYSEAPPGELVALVRSGGLLEVAVVQGNASRVTGAGVGTPVHIRWQP